MKLEELLNKYNEQLEGLKNKKFSTHDEFEELILGKILFVKTELGNLLRVDYEGVKLIKESEIKTYGCVGNELFQLEREIKKDKRVKYDYRGCIINLKFIPCDGITEYVLGLELNTLYSYFEERQRLKAIKFYKEEIKSYKNKISECELKLKKLNKKHNENN